MTKPHLQLRGLTLTGGTTLVGPHIWMRTAGRGAGYEHAHLPPGVAVAVATTVVPAVAFLVPPPVGGEAVAGGRGRGGGARDATAF